MVRQRNSYTLAATIDSLVALTLTVAAVIYANRSRMDQGGVQHFLETRITLLNASFTVVFAVLWQQCLALFGLYKRGYTEILRPTLLTAASCGLMTAVLALYLQLRRAEGPVAHILTVFFIVTFVYETARVLLSSPQLQWNVGEPVNVVILGSGRRAGKAWREVRTRHHRTKRLLGFVDNRDRSEMSPDIAERYLCPVEDLADFLLRNVVDELIVATPMRSCYEMTQEAIAIAEGVGVRVLCLHDIYTLTHRATLRRRADLFIELVPHDDDHLLAQGAKRALDILGATAGLMLLAGLLPFIAIAIKATSRGPVFFLQERYGYQRRRFRMWKFRSMVQNAPELMAALEMKNEAAGPIFKIKDDPRVTRVGSFLRKTSMDELPQLWNVLVGDMSLVGPRPMSVRDVSLFSEAALMRRFSVRPGLTGIWQVAGRSSLTFEQWIAMDFSYIDDWSLSLDLKILARTVPAVLKRSGAA
jgi:exopolysaccharide biosynthesis polyprenyl glycosylphosphotransferase